MPPPLLHTTTSHFTSRLLPSMKAASASGLCSGAFGSLPDCDEFRHPAPTLLSPSLDPSSAQREEAEAIMVPFSSCCSGAAVYTKREERRNNSTFISPPTSLSLPPSNLPHSTTPKSREEEPLFGCARSKAFSPPPKPGLPPPLPPLPPSAAACTAQHGFCSWVGKRQPKASFFPGKWGRRKWKD